MDKNLNNLDPKLKEAYDRVMGSTFTPQSQQQAAPQQAPTQPNQPLMQTMPADPVPQVQSIPVQPPAPSNYQPQLPTQNPFVQTPVPPPTVLTQAEVGAKKKSSFMPVLFLVGGLFFFAAYAFIWAKIFGLI